MSGEARQNTPKRIVALFPQLEGVGGIQEAGRLTACALNQVASNFGQATEFLSLNEPSGLRTIRLNDVEISFRGFSRSKVAFTWAALQLARGAKIVVAAHPHLAIPGAQMKLLNSRLRMITISHGIEIWAPLPCVRRIAFGRSDHFLAPSRYTKEKIALEQRIPAQRIRCIPWPLSPEILRMADHPEEITVPPIFPGGLLVLTVARLSASERYKGVDKLIEAIARIRTEMDNVHLAVVGGGDDLGRHISLAAKLRVTDRVHFFDGLSREQIAGSYLRADIFAMPSTGEGFGLVFLEAMAFGKALIGAFAGGIPDVIEEGTNGFLVDPEDFDQLSERLTTLLQNEQLRTKLGKNGAEVVRTKFAFNKFCFELESIFRNCGLDSSTQ